MGDSKRVRKEIFEFLRRELVGPDPRPEHANLNNGDEVLRPQDPPRLRYSAGVLFPDRSHVEDQDDAGSEEVDEAESGPPENDEPEDVTPGGTGGEPDEDTEHEVNRANEFLPSAMGLTALVHLPDKIKVTIQAARYDRKAVQGVGKQDKKGNWQPHHYRKALAFEPLEIDCNQFKTEKHITIEKPLVTDIPEMKLGLHIYSRPHVGGSDKSLDRILTFTLINRTPMEGERPKDSECLFQCGFSVETMDGTKCFMEYPEREGMEDDEEEQSLRLLYRHRKTFAVGHGCSALWSDTEAASIDRIETETLPAYEMMPVLPNEIPGLQLSMSRLSNVNNPDLVETCERLAAEYLKWIEKQNKVISDKDFPEEYRAVALRHLELCRKCHSRILDGTKLLESNPDIRQSFAWMNEAMLRQQLHYNLAANQRRCWINNTGILTLEKPYKAPDVENPPKGKGQWRPFQLAFILMNLRGIAHRDHSDRSLVDLIWFPTGGGKTEAYLGLTAFTMFTRRLFNRGDAGTTVLMRYTLRLLTTQQFQRAASLICACEMIRRANPSRLGDERISIGLWVGQSVTPNDNREAVKAIKQLLEEGEPNQFVVLTCPWCGAEMGPVKIGNAYHTKGYRRAGSKVIFQCQDPDCDFRDSNGLPLLVVDEEIYAERPTLIVGTVDKFAMLPWRPEARRLFGLDSEERYSPPDLIIQDELHLISGALGSMVGIYESTIDALCLHEKAGKHYPAKIVASTATICRASQQVKSLFVRDVFLFPPQGLRAGDSFFAEEAKTGGDTETMPGRLYVGVFGSALSSHVTAQVRVMSSLLQAVKSVPETSPSEVDPYWTLMAYFNSLRELGHAATLIRADIREHLNAVWDRLGIRRPEKDSGAPDLRRFINNDLELTSRIPSNKIMDALQQLFNQYKGPGSRPVDVCLATNMIQVGLDVPRLGLMTVVGQPKTTSEYIQATSRVGRDAKGPGLVVTVFNPGKPRDRSHYEHFRSYHQSIYRWVEPTSVTPFAIPVRERALHAQLITLIRFWGNKSLSTSPKPVPDDDLISRISKYLLARIKEADPGEADMSEKMIAEFMKRWRTLMPAIYGQFGPPPQETPLMYPSGTEPREIWANRSKATPTSMRNVDAGCDANVIPQYPEFEA